MSTATASGPPARTGAAAGARNALATCSFVLLALCGDEALATADASLAEDSVTLLSPVNASLPLGESDSAFLEAEQAIAQGNRDRYTELAARLENYPLYPYLVYADLERRLERAGTSEIEAFLANYADSPLAPRLKRNWLEQLAKRKRWDTFLEFYEDDGSISLRCHYLRARIANGEREQAFEDVADIWLSGESRPQECDPVFKAWVDAGHLTEELVWERIWLALQRNARGLARYLSRFLPAERRSLLDHWLALRSAPYRVKHIAPQAGETLATRMRVYAVEQLSRSDSQSAAALWRYLSTRHDFESHLIARVNRRIGLSLARDGRPQAANWLRQVPHPDVTVRHWLLANALLSGRWRDALDALPDPEAEGRHEDRWRYWRARALEALGQEAVAIALYRSLAGERSYYGFLAADRIGVPYRFGDDPLTFDASDLLRLARTPPGRRIRVLLSLGRSLDARREWYRWTWNMSEDERAQAAKLAQRWEWHDAGILTVARTPYRDDLGLRFPVAHEAEISRHAAAQGLEPAMVLAMIRQESAFMVDAASPRGARGLMQIMPSTGRRVARSVGVPLKRRSELYEPSINLHLGTVYFRRLLDDKAGNPVLALGAYNAGSRRVEAWRPESGSVPADIWIENISFTETREYIKRVLAYTVVYEHRLGKTPTPLSQRMNGITAPEDSKTG